MHNDQIEYFDDEKKVCKSRVICCLTFIALKIGLFSLATILFEIKSAF